MRERSEKSTENKHEEGRRGGHSGTGRGSPVVHGECCGDASFPPAVHRGPCWSICPRCRPWKIRPEADEYVLKEAADHGDPTQEQAPVRNSSP